MKTESFRYSALLLLSILIVWFWSTTPSLSIYNLQLTGALILLYFVFKKFLRLNVHKSLDIVSTIILSSICLLLVFSTGGAISPLFFLLDFLIIAIALLFEPKQAVVASVALASLFFWNNMGNISTEILINITSLLLMTPIAMIFSNSYIENLRSRGKIKVLEDIIEQEEIESLLWISTQAKPSLVSVLNATTDLVMYFNSKGHEMLLPKGLSDKLKAIQSDLITLYSSTTTLQESISESADKVKLQKD